MNKGTLLWLDDIRDPLTQNWITFSPITPENVVWVKNYEEFVSWIEQNGLPEAICFDHDLGDEHMMDFLRQRDELGRGVKIFPNYDFYKEKTGYEAAKWLVDYCIDNSLPLPKWNVHSANYVGAENIRNYLINYEKSLS